MHTHVLPVTQSVPDVVESVDIDAVVNILIKQAVEIAVKTGFENARSRVHQLAVEILRGCRPQQANPYGSIPGQYGQPQQNEATMPMSLQLIPLYAMAIQKCLALRGGSEVRTDERAYIHQLVQNMDIEQSRVFVYPRLFSLHDMAAETGLPADDAVEDESLVAGPFRIKLPFILNLSHERLSSEGIYLLENGYEIFLRVGRMASPLLLAELFGVNSLDGIDLNTLEIQSEVIQFE